MPLLAVSAAQIDNANDAAAHRHRRAMGNTVECAIEAEARLIEPLILNHDDPGEFDRPRQRNPMFGDVRFILRGVKLDVHNYM